VIETYVCVDRQRLLVPLGDLDWVSAFSLRHAVHDLMEPGIEILIDLSRVESIDATGISALVGCARRVKAAGGTARICNAPPQVQRRLEHVGADRLLWPGQQGNGSDAA
jgi:anti-sigma B factor antagonist